MGEGDRGEKVGSGGAARAGDVQVWDGAGGYGVGKDGPHSEREGGVQGNRAGRGAVEGVLSGGYL